MIIIIFNSCKWLYQDFTVQPQICELCNVWARSKQEEFYRIQWASIIIGLCLTGWRFSRWARPFETCRPAEAIKSVDSWSWSSCVDFQWAYQSTFHSGFSPARLPSRLKFITDVYDWRNTSEPFVSSNVAFLHELRDSLFENMFSDIWQGQSTA